MAQYSCLQLQLLVMQAIIFWLPQGCSLCSQENTYYDFYQNEQRVRSDIAHFQVRPSPALQSVMHCILFYCN